MSPDSDEMSSIDLQKLVESEIKSKKSYLQMQLQTIPADFAFKIREKSDIIHFTRKFGTETIRISIPIRANDDKNYGIRDDDGGRRGPPASFKIQVAITKANRKTLRFIVSAPDDEIAVQSMSIDDKAEEYMVDKDGDLQSGLREYLKSRGIKKSSVDFMYECFVRKAKQAPMRVWNALQVFMED